MGDHTVKQANICTDRIETEIDETDAQDRKKTYDRQDMHAYYTRPKGNRSARRPAAMQGFSGCGC